MTESTQSALYRACPVCGHQNETNARFCSQCGTSFDVQRLATGNSSAGPAQSTPNLPCPKCGIERNNASDRFCELCGQSFYGEPNQPPLIALGLPPPNPGPIRICPLCKHQCYMYSGFCGQCGTSFLVRHESHGGSYPSGPSSGNATADQIGRAVAEQLGDRIYGTRKGGVYWQGLILVIALIIALFCLAKSP